MSASTKLEGDAPKRKKMSLNTFFKELYGDQFGEFVPVYAFK